jgi:hypothetical protein
MVQDPFHVFAYWEITESLKAQVLSRFPEEDRPGFQLVLHWVQIDGSQRTTFDLGTVTYWWLETTPGCHYQAHLCFYSEIYGAKTILESNIVETPKYSIEPSGLLAAEDPDATDWLNDLLELTSVARKTPESDSSLTQSGLPTQQAVPTETKDRPAAEDEYRSGHPDNSAVHNRPLPNNWPTSR